MHLKTLMGLSLLAITIGIHSVPAVRSSAATLHYEILGHEVLRQVPDPISGEWEVTFFVHGSTTPATFTLKLEGDKVTGAANSVHTGPGTIRDGSWIDNKLSFTLDFKSHESIAINGTLQDGKLVGEFRTEGFVAKWEAKKK